MILFIFYAFIYPVQLTISCVVNYLSCVVNYLSYLVNYLFSVVNYLSSEINYLYKIRLASKTTDINWVKAKDIGDHMEYYADR